MLNLKIMMDSLYLLTYTYFYKLLLYIKKARQTYIYLAALNKFWCGIAHKLMINNS